MSANVRGFTNKTIINQQAAQWVLLLEDTPKLTKKQIDELNAWVSTSDIHRECLESMVQSWREMNLLSSVMLPQEMQKPSTFSVMLTNILMPIVALFALLCVLTKRRKNIFTPIIATPLLLCVFIGAVLFITQPINEDKRLVFTTNIGEHLNHTLKDGSIIWLNSSTKIIVNYSDGFRRINLLEGEAHFEVAKDAARPFEVYADDRLVRAIGTAFSVHKLKGNIEIIVSEGTVELAVVENTLVMIPDDFQRIKIDEDMNDNSADKPLTSDHKTTEYQPANVKQMLGKLTAGQRISIPTKHEKLSNVVELDTSEITRSLSWKEGKLVFAGESLEEVINEITRHTKVKIDVLDPQLKSMRIGGQFKVGETDTLFYVLESGFGIYVNKLSELHVQLQLKEK